MIFRTVSVHQQPSNYRAVESRVTMQTLFRAGRYRLEIISARAKRVWSKFDISNSFSSVTSRHFRLIVWLWLVSELFSKQRRSQRQAWEGPGPPKCLLCLALNWNSKRSWYSNKTVKYSVFTIGFLAHLTHGLWTFYCCWASCMGFPVPVVVST